MKSIPLLSNRFKKLGWFLLILLGLLLVLKALFDTDSDTFTFHVFSIFSSVGLEDGRWFVFSNQDVSYTVLSCLFIIGSLLVMFSEDKVEDEFIKSVRMNALMWAVLLHFLLLILAFIGVYGLAFASVVIYNTYTVLLIFMLRYYYLVYQNRRLLDEK